MRNLLTNAVFDRTFKAGEKFKEPDLQEVSASYLYSDGSGSYFLDQESFETHTLTGDMMGNALEFLTDGALVELLKYNGNPIGLELPAFVELVAPRKWRSWRRGSKCGCRCLLKQAKKCACRPKAGSSAEGRRTVRRGSR